MTYLGHMVENKVFCLLQLAHKHDNIRQMETTNLLNKKEKAQELNISIRTLDRRVKKNKIEVIRVGKSKRRWFLPGKVDEYD